MDNGGRVAGALSSATAVALSNSATAPRICRMSLDVGPSSSNDAGLSAAINVIPRLGQHHEPDFLHHQVTREALGCLDYDGPYTVAGDANAHGSEARPAIDGVGAASTLARDVVVLNSLFPPGVPLGSRPASRDHTLPQSRRHCCCSACRRQLRRQHSVTPAKVRTRRARSRFAFPSVPAC
jgi:hypothetical protein